MKQVVFFIGVETFPVTKLTRSNHLMGGVSAYVQISPVSRL